MNGATVSEFKCSCGETIQLVNHMSTEAMSEHYEQVHRYKELYEILVNSEASKLAVVAGIVDNLKDSDNPVYSMYAQFLDLWLRDEVII